MIWLKRLAPFVLIALGYFGWEYYQTTTAKAYLERENTYADVISQLWVASVTYRDSTLLYETFRDSLMKEKQVDSTTIAELIQQYEKNPQAISSLVQKIKIITDSLIKLRKTESIDSI